MHSVNISRLSRRAFLRGSMTTGALLATAACAHVKDAKGAHAMPFEFPEYRDTVTGARIRMLTQGPARDAIVYQTHPMWTPGMDYLMFMSDRAGATSPHAVELKSGEIRRVVDRDCTDHVLARKDDSLYFLSEREVRVTALRQSFQAAPTSKHVASLPDWLVQTDGGFSLDANEKTLYAGAVLVKDTRWALAALDLEHGTWHRVIELDFRIGHVQANPFTSGVIMFCHETGGDAPQRMWVVNGDGSGLKPFYKETYSEWVTHEVWWGADRAIFTVWPYDEERTRKPHGILSADLATGTPRIHTQYPAWHTHGSPDLKWAVGDDFDRNLWLVKADTSERRLLTQGHLSKGFDTHPHASFTPDNKGIVFSSSRNGAEDIFLVDMPEWESLPKA
jgi:oligogalacturonide lyase